MHNNSKSTINNNNNHTLRALFPVTAQWYRAGHDRDTATLAEAYKYFTPSQTPLVKYTYIHKVMHV